eukprot:gene1480-biopygen2510
MLAHMKHTRFRRGIGPCYVRVSHNDESDHADDNGDAKHICYNDADETDSGGTAVVNNGDGNNDDDKNDDDKNDYVNDADDTYADGINVHGDNVDDNITDDSDVGDDNVDGDDLLCALHSPDTTLLLIFY